MIKILIADADATSVFRFSQFLTNDENFNIEKAYDGRTTIELYDKIKPNILILNSNIHDMNYIQIINHLSSLPDEKHKSNIILVLNKPEDYSLLRNVSKVYAIFESNFDENEMLETIQLMSSEFETPSLTLDELRVYLLQFNFSRHSICTDYMLFSIRQCYYYPETFTTLNNIFKIVAEKFNVKTQTVREGMRKSLEPLNLYQELDPTNRIFKLFVNRRTKLITPCYFLEVIVPYLRNEKNKKQ